MKKKHLAFIMATVIISTAIVTPTTSAFANSYDNTTINSELNSTEKPDHITLSWNDDPTTTMTITWRTDTSVKQESIEYKEISESSSDSQTISDIKPKIFKTSINDKDTGEMNLYTTTLKGLKPGTEYTYRVGNDENGWSKFNSFTTESSDNIKQNNFKFLVFGDSQSGNFEVPNYNSWHTTIQNAFNSNKDANFFINMGDLVEKGQYYTHWNNWYNSVEGVIDNIPDMVVQGNHETYDANDWNSTKPEYFTNQFNIYQNGPNDLKGQTYSYNYGNVHFVALDSQASEESEDASGTVNSDKEKAMLEEQAAWLEKDLKANKDAKFTFVFFHKTPYYNKAQRANTLIKEILCPIFDKYHVDVVFNGHDHATSRTFPIKNDEIVQSPSEGTVYYVTGRSGAKYYPDLTPKVWDAKFYDPQDEPDYQTVELNGGKLTIKAFKQDGTLVDTYVIDKDNPQNNTSNKEIIPSKYNVGTDKAIGDSARLVIYGNPVTFGSAKAEIKDGKAYADLNTIAAYIGGNYNLDTKTLEIGDDKYTFTDDMLSSDKKRASIDALNNMGFSAKYDTKFNMVMIEK